MIPENKLKEIRQALLNSARPLVFFDDDPDGLCSFLQFYKLNNDAKGVIYKVAGPLDERFLRKIDEIQPDTIFILDVPEVSQTFLDKARNVYWLDHHSPLNRKHVKYYNPMLWEKKDNRPVSYYSAKITNNCNWLAMTGSIGDWFIPEDLRKDFEYPELLPKNITSPDAALFSSPLGQLSRVFSFVLKGTTRDAMTHVKIPKDALEVQQEKLEKWRFIMDSCNKDELEDPEIISGSRMERIAKGSGVSVKEVRELMKQYRQAKKLMKMFKGGKNIEKMMKRFPGMSKLS